MSIQGWPSFFRLSLVFVLLLSAQVYAQNKLSEKKGKRMPKNEILSQRFLKSFYGILKLGHPDSAATYLKSNDSLVLKSASLSKSKLNFDLAKAYESDKQFNKALSTYYVALGDQQKIRTKDQKLALGSILRLYSKSQTADSLSKYLKVALALNKTNATISPVFERIRIKSHFLMGQFDSVRLDIASYQKKNPNVPFPPYLSMIIALMHIKEGRYEEATSELEKIIAHTSSGQDSKIESELLKIDILTNKGKEKESYQLAKALYEAHKLNTSISDEAKGLVLYTYASQLFRNGKYKEALEINGEAIKLLKSFTLENNLYHGRALLLSAMIYNDLTDFGAAQLYLSNAQSVLAKSCGTEHTYSDEYVYSLGFVHYSMEKFQEAQKEVDKAIDLQKRIYGNHNIPLAQSFNLKGNIFEKSGKTAISRNYLDSSLFIYKTIVEDKEHPLYGKLFNDIGIVEQRKEVIPASISSYKESLRIFEKLYGKVHPDISIGFTNVASLYRDL
ncbi:MAG: tetratricopeptide repeat protein, partial [Cytophagales bacterium]|nr:tetratricopeptide repeat protein [Cytophagales bacterium]